MKRPRISLRTALIALTVVGIGCGLVARWLAMAQLPADAAVVIDAPAIYRFQQENSRKWFEFQQKRGVLQTPRPRDVERLKRQSTSQSIE